MNASPNRSTVHNALPGVPALTLALTLALAAAPPAAAQASPTGPTPPPAERESNWAGVAGCAGLILFVKRRRRFPW